MQTTSVSSPTANSSVTRQDPKAFQKTTIPQKYRGRYSGKVSDSASKKEPLTDMSDLHWEILHGTYENIVVLLSSAQADLEKPNSRGYYPVHTCVHNNDIQTLEALIQAKANLNRQTKNGYQSTPLHIAIANEYEAIIKTLGNHGANFHITNAAGFSPLENLVQTGSLPLVRLAIEKYGASPFRAGFDGKSLVDFAKTKSST